MRPLTLVRLLELIDDGAQLLDTRDSAEFEAAHMRGAVNVGLGGSYATWCGTILDRVRPVVLIAHPGREVEAATRLGRIGFDNVAGYLAGGIQPPRPRARIAPTYPTGQRRHARRAARVRASTAARRRADRARMANRTDRQCHQHPPYRGW